MSQALRYSTAMQSDVGARPAKLLLGILFMTALCTLLVEIVLVGWSHRAYFLTAGAGFMIRPIACTSCDQRSCSRASWALPSGVSW